jgi:hypothetical protein
VKKIRIFVTVCPTDQSEATIFFTVSPPTNQKPISRPDIIRCRF